MWSNMFHSSFWIVNMFSKEKMGADMNNNFISLSSVATIQK